MMIEFQCGNLLSYDKAAGRYQECGHRIIVSDDKIGEFVTCPKCQQTVEVPFESLDVPPKPTSRLPVSPSTSKPVASAKSTETQRARAKRRGAEGGEMKLAEPVRRPKSDLGALSFGDIDSADRTLPKDTRQRCVKCGKLHRQQRTLPELWARRTEIRKGDSTFGKNEGRSDGLSIMVLRDDGAGRLGQRFEIRRPFFAGIYRVDVSPPGDFCSWRLEVHCVDRHYRWFGESLRRSGRQGPAIGFDATRKIGLVSKTVLERDTLGGPQNELARLRSAI